MSKEALQDDTKGFRFMGQRFTPDAFVFSTLTQGDEIPDPETGEKLPSSPTALMAMSVFGDTNSDVHLDQWVQKNAPESQRVLKNRLSMLKSTFSAAPDAVWGQNIYWAWISTLRTLFRNESNLDGYPMFYKNTAWRDKDTQSALGSWTELKHDTLLYAKQSYAEMGGGGEGEIPPVPKGYVEPNVEFFDRLIALTEMTSRGLSSRSLLPNEFLGRNDSFAESLRFLRDIAVSELEDTVISDDDFEKLRSEIPSTLNVVLMPLPSEQSTEGGARSALIADVHTDVPGNKIVYEATSIPDFVYVSVKDANGTRLTKGLTFSYREFSGDLDKRISDEEWRENVYSHEVKSIPPKSDWALSLEK